ncbi:hypothetical protein SSBR45G_58430 [Bradyrhizobium sp. SSBR45G]|nr:hypothetical protein SSBR45G_58430 [Bradyrhizobium sp. SSBR45G]GLH88406.1 hypothetical protein SSBR45R_58670 [Bradyrhizobium sp. SSBR45R]
MVPAWQLKRTDRGLMVRDAPRAISSNPIFLIGASLLTMRDTTESCQAAGPRPEEPAEGGRLEGRPQAR